MVTPALAAQNVAIYINSQEEVNVDSYFVVTVEISEVADLNGAQYIIVFDPAVLQLENIDSGQIGSNELNIMGTQDVAPGQVKVLQQFGFESINGEGYLAVVHFTALKSGSSIIGFSVPDCVLSGFGEDFATTWTGSTVVVVSEEGSAQGQSGSQNGGQSSGTETVEETAGSSSDTGSEESAAGTEDESTADVQSGETGTEISGDEGKTESQDAKSGEQDTTGNENSGTIENQVSGQADDSENGIKWPVLGGIIGGVAVILVAIIFEQLRRNRY